MIVIGVSGCSSTPKDTTEGKVTRVVDGGTVSVLIDGAVQPVHLLNVETPSEAGDPDSTGCLQQESIELTEQLLPPGSTVRLEFATQRENASGQTVAAVFVNDTSVNEAIAAAGLGIPDLSDGETTFLSGISTAYEQARKARVGLFSTNEKCTVPAKVMAATGIDCIEAAGVASANASPGSSLSSTTTSSVTQSKSETVTSASTSPVVIAVGSSSDALKQQARTAAATLATAIYLQSRAGDNTNALIWRALNQAQRESCTGTIKDLVQRSTRDHAALLTAVAAAEKQEAEAARVAEEQRKAVETARVAEEQRIAAEAEAARIADEQQKAAEAARVAEEQRVAAEAEAARVAAEQAQVTANKAAEEQRRQQSINNSGSSSSGGSNNSNNSSNSSGGVIPPGTPGPAATRPAARPGHPANTPGIERAAVASELSMAAWVTNLTRL